MFFLPISRVDFYTRHSGAFFCLGVLLLAQPFVLPRGWGVGVFTGFALLSLAIYAFAFRRWRTEPGLWMLALMLVVLWTRCWVVFEFGHWKSVFAKVVAQPAPAGLTWQQIRFLIDAVLGLSVMAESIRLALTVARENWRVSRELKQKMQDLRSTN